MRKLAYASAVPLLFLMGCAAQPASQQLTKKETVRVCQGNYCTDQASSTITRESAPVNTEAERRLEALEALAQNNPQAAYDLGLRLMRGDGVQQDSYQAIEWLRQAGDNGIVPAQLALGRLYLSGLQEMGSDPAEAASWLSRAAAAGNQEAKRLLPQAEAARQDEHALYEVREALRKSNWYYGAPYYWYWGPAGWKLR